MVNMSKTQQLDRNKNVYNEKLTMVFNERLENLNSTGHAVAGLKHHYSCHLILK